MDFLNFFNNSYTMFNELEKINDRPEPFEFYTANDLWTDDHTSKEMLAFHLNKDIDVSSRNTNFIDRSVEWIISHFKVEADTKIADFGCGPGLYATRLAKKHADVTAIDFSKRSIDYAKEVSAREGLSIDYINQNYLEFETEKRFQLILMIMCDFCALSPTQRSKMLNKFYSILEQGGHVLLDVYSIEDFRPLEEVAIYETNLLNGFWSPNTYYGFINTFKYEEEKVVLDKYTIIEASRTRTVYNWLQYFSPEELEKEFVESGFKVESLYSDVAGAQFKTDTKEIAIVAKKN